MKKQKNQMRLKHILISLICMSVNFSFAQESGDKGVIVDEIIAKVDDRIILKSDLEKAYLEHLSSGEYQSNNAKCEILQNLIVNKMLVVQSNLDSVFVEDDEVNANLDRRMQILVSQFNGNEEIEKAYGKSITQIRSEVFDNVKEQMTIQKMQNELTSGLKVTPAEVRKFFREIPRDSLPFFSTQVSVAQIVRDPVPGKDQEDKVKSLLLSIRSKIERGESFATFAQKHSEDPGSAARGGQLPFYNRGELAPEYEATALALSPGELSMPIKSQFGFHLIELQEKRGNTFKTRHILIKPQPDDDDFQKAYSFVDSLRTLILVDSTTFQNAAKTFSSDQETSSSGGFFLDNTGSNKVSVEALDPNIFFTLDTMKVGSISRPIRFQNPDGLYSYRMLFYQDRIAPHQANLNDDYQRIAGTALMKKKNFEISSWFELARENVYIQIDPEYNYCDLAN